MYKIKKTYVKKKWHWHKVDVTNKIIDVLLKEFQEIRVRVSWDGEDDYMLDLRKNLHHLTVEDYGLRLKTVIEGKEKKIFDYAKQARMMIDSDVVTYRPIYEYGVKTEAGNRNYGVGQPIPYGEDIDLCLTTLDLPEYDSRHVSKLKDNVLVTINGRVFDTVYKKERLFIKNGHKEIKHHPTYIVSAIDFSKLGGFVKEGIFKENLTVLERTEDDVTLNRSRVLVDFKTDSMGKTPILVINGYLHILDDTYRVVSDKKMLIDIDHKLAVTRAIRTPYNRLEWFDPANVRMNGIRTDHFYIDKYLDQTESFIIWINTDDLSLYREDLKATGVIGAYNHYRAPKGLVFNSEYELQPYRITDYNRNVCEIRTLPNIYRPLILDTVEYGYRPAISTGEVSTPRLTLHDAFCLDLYVF